MLRSLLLFVALCLGLFIWAIVSQSRVPWGVDPSFMSFRTYESELWLPRQIYDIPENGIKTCVPHETTPPVMTEEMLDVGHGPLRKTSGVAICIEGQARTMHDPIVQLTRVVNRVSMGVPTKLFHVIVHDANGVPDCNPIERPDEVVVLKHSWHVKETSKVARRFPRMSHTLDMLMRWNMCLRVVRRHELKTGRRFSHIVQQRSDIVLTRPMGPVSEWTTDTIMSAPYPEDAYIPPWVPTTNGYTDLKKMCAQYGSPRSRLGCEKTMSAYKTDLMNIIPRKHWRTLFHDFIHVPAPGVSFQYRESNDGVIAKLFDHFNLTRSYHSFHHRIKRPSPDLKGGKFNQWY